jgi:hypothetical protein
MAMCFLGRGCLVVVRPTCCVCVQVGFFSVAGHGKLGARR